MRISFHYDIEKFRLRDSKIIKKIAGRIVSEAGMKTGLVDVVITGDDKVYEINREFLGHDYLTDIITFDYKKGNTVEGEIYISADRVRENASKFGVTAGAEMRPVEDVEVTRIERRSERVMDSLNGRLTRIRSPR